MKILLLGKTGQVGGALTPLLRQLAGSSADEALVTLGRADVDLSDAAALAQAVQQVQPSLIVNAAAHTAVDRAETSEAVECIAAFADADGVALGPLSLSSPVSRCALSCGFWGSLPHCGYFYSLCRSATPNEPTRHLCKIIDEVLMSFSSI
jgi:dTDP-4-dehydrorhamnose reductase